MNDKPQPLLSRSKPISLYGLKFEEIVRDVLTIKPPPKEMSRKAMSSKASETPSKTGKKIAPVKLPRDGEVDGGEKTANRIAGEVAKEKRKK